MFSEKLARNLPYNLPYFERSRVMAGLIMIGAYVCGVVIGLVALLIGGII
jgi:hypothetical protein